MTHLTSSRLDRVISIVATLALVTAILAVIALPAAAAPGGSSVTVTLAPSPLPATLEQIQPTAATYVTASFLGSAVGDVTAPVTFVGLACNGTTISIPAGDIALVQRGLCDFAQKALNAQAAGASAVIIANSDGMADFVVGVTLEPSTANIPVVTASFADGESLKQAGSTARVNVTPYGETVTLVYGVNRAAKAIRSRSCTLDGESTACGSVDSQLSTKKKTVFIVTLSGLDTGDHTFEVAVSLTDGGSATASRTFTVHVVETVIWEVVLPGGVLQSNANNDEPFEPGSTVTSLSATLTGDLSVCGVFGVVVRTTANSGNEILANWFGAGAVLNAAPPTSNLGSSVVSNGSDLVASGLCIDPATGSPMQFPQGVEVHIEVEVS